MAKTRKSTTRKSTAKNTAAKTVATTTVATENKPTEIVPRVPRQLPLKSLSTIQKKKAATATAASEEVILQLWDKEISHKEILERVRADYLASGASEAINSLKAYIKPEEGKIYYVINEDFQGSIDY